MRSDSRAQLLARQRDLFASLRTLEKDRLEGDIDTDAYTVSRQRYEREAAGILERLDVVARDEENSHYRPRRASLSRGRSWLVAGSSMALVAAAIIIFLVNALQHRGTGQSITGAQPGVVLTPSTVPSPVLVAAQRAVRIHPRSVDALLTLGQAYLNTNVAAADRAFLAAMHLAPNRPEPPTLHALVLASLHSFSAALGVLRIVERSHPRYARAWLEDGLIASRRRPGFPRAIAAWKHFLALEPLGPVSGQVRGFLAALERTQKAAR